MISLKDLLSQTYPEFLNDSRLSDVPVRGVECDSRKVEKGFLFVAVRGVKEDGHAFIREAVERGAVAVVGEERQTLASEVPFILVPECRTAMARLACAFYKNPSNDLKVIGVTGTNGKTTSSFLVEHLLRQRQKRVGVLGTVHYRFENHVIPAKETTPGALRIQQILAEMRSGGCEYVVMEVSSHALHQQRVGGIQFEAALFTNLTQDHLDYHGTMEEYFQAKSRLFLDLLPEKTSLLNRDDAWAQKLEKKVSSRKVTYAVHHEADLRAQEIEYKQSRTAFKLLFQGQAIPIESPLIGLHNVYNVLGAFATMSVLGFDLKNTAEHLRSFSGVPGRLESVDCGQNFLVFVDFAHTPDGLQNVLSSLKPYRKNKLIVVFGCGGDRDKNKRPKMGKIAAEFSDFVYVTSDNPRSENPADIAREVQAGFPPNFKNYVVVLDRKKAIRQALLSARESDMVLLAGKGHETTQVISDRVLPFNDREEAERVLNGR